MSDSGTVSFRLSFLIGNTREAWDVDDNRLRLPVYVVP